LEAENRQLRNQAIQLVLQIQVLRRAEASQTKSAGSRAPSMGIPAASRRRPLRSP
jgi:hypothetical protein